MNDPSRLGMSVTHADGTITRWGPDELKAQDIPGDLTFSTQIPGGFKDLSCSLLRRIDLDYPDQALFDSVRVYGPGNRTVWEGRMAQFPRSHGDGFQIVPGAVGWSAHLGDDPSFQEIYVNRDMSVWGTPPTDRQLVLATAGLDQQRMGDWQNGGPAITLPLQNVSTPGIADAEIWSSYPVPIKFLYYLGSTTSLPGTWVVWVRAIDDPSVNPDTYTPTLDSGIRAITLSTARKWLGLQVYANASTATPAAGAIVYITKLAAIGNHGLTSHTTTGSDPNGFYASDVVEDIVTRTAPLLALGEIEATSFAIPHLVFPDPTTGESAIQFVNAYHGFDWGVYDNREFFYRSSDASRLTWQARLSAGALLDLEGETAEQVFNGVYVTYTDPSGLKKTVGPPGATADDTDSALEDTDPLNPVNAHGIDRRWGVLDISQTTTLEGAVQLGTIWLLEHSLPQRRGTLTLTGMVTHPTEGDVPAWRVRAGDYVSIADHPADVPRKIIETRYTHGTRELVLNLDNTPYMLDALLQRFGAGLVGVL